MHIPQIFNITLFFIIDNDSNQFNWNSFPVIWHCNEEKCDGYKYMYQLD